jgi:iron complex outermembrane recepter protein
MIMQKPTGLPGVLDRVATSSLGARLALAVLLVVPSATPVSAQDSVRVQPLPPLSVTASRAPVSLFDVPLAVTVVGADQLRLRRGVGLDEALSLVPGVIAQSRSGGGDVRISIRGFGSRGAGDRSNAGTSRGVRILIDGIPETEPDGRTALDLVDLALVEEVEVVRSNASSLYGNAAGGVLDLRTLPAPGSRLGSVQAQAGSFGLKRLIGRTALPLGAGTAYAGVANTHLDGWRAHSQSDRTTLLGGVSAPVGESTTLAVLLAAGNDRFQIPGPLTRAQADADPRLANATYAARDERRFNRVARLGATLDHRVDADRSLSAMLFVTPKILQRSERGTYRDFTRYHLGGNVVYRDQHPVADGVRGRLTAGMDEAYQDGAILFYDLTAEGTRGAGLRDNKREGANNTGVFVEEQLAFGERLLLTVGARHDAIGYYNQNYIRPTLDASRTFSRTTPKVGATWKLSGSHALYANVGGGVEVPAGNETDPASTFGQDTVTSLNPLLEPIRSTTYEVGTKRIVVLGANAGLLRSASYDVALYDTEVRNEIVPYRGGRFYFTAGRVRRQGAELGLALVAAGGVSARGALTLNRHRYLEYQVDSVHYGAPGRFANYAGNRVVGVPSVHYGASLGLAPAALAGIRLEAGVTGVGPFYADDANLVEVPGYMLLNATLGFDDPVTFGRRYGVRGFLSVNNLTGRRYIGSAFLNPDVVAGQPVAFEPGRPREVVMGLTVGAL